MRGLLSPSFLLLVGCAWSLAEDAGADSTSMHDSGLLPQSPPQSASALQQGEAEPGSAARNAYMLSDSQGLDLNSMSDQPQLDAELLEKLQQLVQQEQKRLAYNRRSYAPMFVGKKSAPMFVGKKSAPYFLGKKAAPYFLGRRAAPYFVGKRAAPYFVGKKSAPMFVGKKSAPYFLGKRAAPYFVGKKSAPYFLGKKAAPYFVGRRAAPYFVGKKAAPMFIGKKSAPMFVGKKSAPMFVGKKSAPMFIGKRRLADILDSMAGSNMQELSVSPLTQVASTDMEYPRVVKTLTSLHPIQPYSQYTIHKRNMYPAPYFVGKRTSVPQYVGKRNSVPRYVGKRKEESIKDLFSVLHYYEAARRYRRLVQAQKRFKAPLFVGRRSSPPQEATFSWDTNY